MEYVFFDSGLVSVTMSSQGHDEGVYMVVASNIHSGSHELQSILRTEGPYSGWE